MEFVLILVMWSCRAVSFVQIPYKKGYDPSLHGWYLLIIDSSNDSIRIYIFHFVMFSVHSKNIFVMECCDIWYIHICVCITCILYGGDMRHASVNWQDGKYQLNLNLNLNYERIASWGVCQLRTAYPRSYSDSKVHGANMGPIWGQQDPGGPHVGPVNFAIWVCIYSCPAELPDH